MEIDDYLNSSIKEIYLIKSFLKDTSIIEKQKDLNCTSYKVNQVRNKFQENHY
jgi:hypothetical protein